MLLKVILLHCFNIHALLSDFFTTFAKFYTKLNYHRTLYFQNQPVNNFRAILA